MNMLLFWSYVNHQILNCIKIYRKSISRYCENIIICMDTENVRNLIITSWITFIGEACPWFPGILANCETVTNRNTLLGKSIANQKLRLVALYKEDREDCTFFKWTMLLYYIFVTSHFLLTNNIPKMAVHFGFTMAVVHFLVFTGWNISNEMFTFTWKEDEIVETPWHSINQGQVLTNKS